MPTRQTVIRKRYVKELEQHGFVICGICEFPIVREKDLTVDHIVPKAAGGYRYRVGNMQPAHFVCNQRKGQQENYKLTTETKE